MEGQPISLLSVLGRSWERGRKSEWAGWVFILGCSCLEVNRVPIYFPHIFPGLSMSSGDGGTGLAPTAIHVACYAAHFLMHLCPEPLSVLHCLKCWPLAQRFHTKSIMLLMPTEMKESGTQMKTRAWPMCGFSCRQILYICYGLNACVLPATPIHVLKS